mmetsp:Transcript_43073/g.105730  ORF Transcript_43073/g.105730 Transcript_43073/m.105730 type:complete len:340 (+) Transcript_43073:245-1264(+)
MLRGRAVGDQPRGSAWEAGVAPGEFCVVQVHDFHSHPPHPDGHQDREAPVEERPQPGGHQPARHLRVLPRVFRPVLLDPGLPVRACRGEQPVPEHEPRIRVHLRGGGRCGVFEPAGVLRPAQAARGGRGGDWRLHLHGAVGGVGPRGGKRRQEQLRRWCCVVDRQLAGRQRIPCDGEGLLERRVHGPHGRHLGVHVRPRAPHHDRSAQDDALHLRLVLGPVASGALRRPGPLYGVEPGGGLGHEAQQPPVGGGVLSAGDGGDGFGGLGAARGGPVLGGFRRGAHHCCRLVHAGSGEGAGAGPQEVGIYIRVLTAAGSGLQARRGPSRMRFPQRSTRSRH